MFKGKIILYDLVEFEYVKTDLTVSVVLEKAPNITQLWLKRKLLCVFCLCTERKQKSFALVSFSVVATFD